MRFLVLSLTLLLLGGCTPNIIEDWDRGFVVRESHGEGQAWYLQLVTGGGEADACGVATTESPIEGYLHVQYKGDSCEVDYRK